DYLVEGEGETALLGITDVLDGKCAEDTIPNLIYQVHGKVTRSRVTRYEEDIHALGTPDFRGLNIDDYFAPTPVFLLPVARGCYMGCTFCAVSFATSGYRSRTGQEIVGDIRAIQHQFGADVAYNFNFSIDVMAPKHLGLMSAALIDSGLAIRWDAEIR